MKDVKIKKKKINKEEAKVIRLDDNTQTNNILGVAVVSFNNRWISELKTCTVINTN